MKTHLIYLSIIAVLVIVLCLSFLKPRKEIERVQYKTDTLTVIRTDTVHHTEVKWRDRTVVDTVLLKINDTVYYPLPISAYRFSEEGVYDIRAKGYNVELTDVTVFPKTEYRTVRNTIEKEVTVHKWDVYLGAKITALKGEINPSATVYITNGRKWLFGAEIGYYGGNVTYGGTIAYKLTK